MGWQTIARTAGIYVMATLVSITILITSYIGFTVFFYCSMLVLTTPCTLGLGYLADVKEFRDCFICVIMWCLYVIPLISLVLTINWRLFSGFFSKVKDVFDLDRMAHYIECQFGKKVTFRNGCIIATLFLFCTVCITLVVLFFNKEVGVFSWISFGVGAISLIAPVIAFMKPPFYAWVSIIKCIRSSKKDKKADPISEPMSTVSMPLLADESLVTYRDDESLGDLKNKEEEHISLIDPFKIMVQEDWMSFMNSRSNIFVGIRQGDSIWQLVVAILFLVIVVAFLGMDVYTSQSMIKGMKSVMEELKQQITELEKVGIFLDGSIMEFDIPHLIAGFIIRCILTVYFVPFIMTANIATILTKWKYLKEQAAIRVSHIIGTALIILYFIVFIVWSIWQENVFSDTRESFPEGYTNISIIGAPILLPEDFQIPLPSICTIKSNSVTLMDLAALNALAQLSRFDLNASNIFFREVFYNYTSDNTSVTWTGLPGGQAVPDMELIFPVYFAVRREKQPTPWGEYVYGVSPIWAVGGSKEGTSLGFLIENIVGYWYAHLMNGLIPFFNIVKEMFMSDVLETISKYVDTWFLGFQSVTELYTRVQSYIMAVMDKYLQYHGGQGYRNILLTGHSAGGLFAKSYAAYQNQRAVTFEAPEFEHSRIFQALIRQDNNSFGWTHLINVYSPNSILSMEEESATINVNLPPYQSFLKPANAYSTLCYLAAACATSDIYDHFCVHTIGKDTYESYFKAWNRNRLEIRDIYLTNSSKSLI